MSYQSAGELIPLDVGLYSIIFSYLDDTYALRLLSKDPSFRYVFKSPVFWTELIRQEFHQYYLPDVSGYNWKEVYFGLVYYSSPIVHSYRMNKLGLDYQEAKRYLILNDLIKSKNYSIMHYYIRYSDLDMVKHIIKRYPLQSYIMTVVWYVLGTGHPDVLEYLLDSEYQDAKGVSHKVTSELIIIDLIDVILDSPDKDPGPMTNEEFRIIFNHVDLKVPRNFKAFIAIALRLKQLNGQTLEYILNRLPNTLDLNYLLELLEDSIEYYHGNLLEILLRKYHGEIDKSYISYLIKLANDILENEEITRDECENIINILQMK